MEEQELLPDSPSSSGSPDGAPSTWPGPAAAVAGGNAVPLSPAGLSAGLPSGGGPASTETRS